MTPQAWCLASGETEGQSGRHPGGGLITLLKKMKDDGLVEIAAIKKRGPVTAIDCRLPMEGKRSLTCDHATIGKDESSNSEPVGDRPDESAQLGGGPGLVDVRRRGPVRVVHPKRGRIDDRRFLDPRGAALLRRPPPRGRSRRDGAELGLPGPRRARSQARGGAIQTPCGE